MAQSLSPTSQSNRSDGYSSPFGTIYPQPTAQVHVMHGFLPAAVERNSRLAVSDRMKSYADASAVVQKLNNTPPRQGREGLGSSTLPGFVKEGATNLANTNQIASKVGKTALGIGETLTNPMSFLLSTGATAVSSIVNTAINAHAANMQTQIKRDNMERNWTAARESGLMSPDQFPNSNYGTYLGRNPTSNMRGNGSYSTR